MLFLWFYFVYTLIIDSACDNFKNYVVFYLILLEKNVSKKYNGWIIRNSCNNYVRKLPYCYSLKYINV